MQGLPSKAMAARAIVRVRRRLFLVKHQYVYIYRNHAFFNGLYQPMYSKFGDGLLFTIAVLTLVIYKVLIIKHGARIDFKLVDDYRRCYILPLNSGNRNLHHTTIIKYGLIIKCICVKIGYRKIKMCLRKPCSS